MEGRGVAGRGKAGEPLPGGPRRRGPSAAMVALCAVAVGFGWWGSEAAGEEQRFGGCPRASFRAMFEAAADHDEVGDIAAIERDAFELCARRQELINVILGGEAKLITLVADGAAGPEEGGLESVAAVSALPAKSGGGVDGPGEEPPAGGAMESVIVIRPEPEPEYRWTVVYGSAGEWIGGVSDGTKVWYVRAGDELPAGIKVVEVRLRPPGVAVRSEGEEWFLAGPRGVTAAGE